MKKRLLIILSILTILVSTGCGKMEEVKKKIPDNIITVADRRFKFEEDKYKKAIYSELYGKVYSTYDVEYLYVEGIVSNIKNEGSYTFNVKTDEEEIPYNIVAQYKYLEEIQLKEGDRVKVFGSKDNADKDYMYGKSIAINSDNIVILERKYKV